MKWVQLRQIQVDAIHCFNDTSGDILIEADTASGKTEAAFLPLLSKIADDFSGSVKALYVGPLKALINDQFRRLEELCVRAAIPVHRWHGDVSGSQKKKLVQKPAGILLITPESIESLFINRSAHLGKIFNGLDYIVVDEIHSFMGTERGIHLLSLLSRLHSFSKAIPRRIGLSATIGDSEATCDWIRAMPNRHVQRIKGESGRSLAVIIKGYKHHRPKNNKTDDDADFGDFFQVGEDIFKAFRGKKNLIFGNAKARLEMFTDILTTICREKGVPNEFRIHHGSLAKNIREETEERMQTDRPYTTFCTNTLELGIDIGYLDSIGQIDPPFSVSSLVQRIGRSGREEGATAKLRFFIQEMAPDPHSPPWHTLYQDLLQAVAMIELLLAKWCESPLRGKLHYSTLIQQILSVLAQTGGIRADKLFSRLIGEGVFQQLSAGDFSSLLRCIAQHDLIEQMPEGDLILGLAGQRIVNHYDFYAAFKSPEEYRVLNNGHLIGSLPLDFPIPIEEHLILGGKRWQVIARDDKKKEILVVKARGRKPPYFLSGYGDISEKIRAKMFEILFDGSIPVYLDFTAQEMFLEARKTAIDLDLKNQRFHRFGMDTIVFTWTSSKINKTLAIACELLELKVSDFGIGLKFENKPVNEVKRTLKQARKKGVEQLKLAEYVDREFKQTEKYDGFLPDHLLNRAYEVNRLDIQGTNSLIAELV